MKWLCKRTSEVSASEDFETFTENHVYPRLAFSPKSVCSCVSCTHPYKNQLSLPFVCSLDKQLVCERDIPRKYCLNPVFLFLNRVRMSWICRPSYSTPQFIQMFYFWLLNQNILLASSVLVVSFAALSRTNGVEVQRSGLLGSVMTTSWRKASGLDSVTSQKNHKLHLTGFRLLMNVRFTNAKRLLHTQKLLARQVVIQTQAWPPAGST